MYIKFTQNVNFEGVNYTADSESKAVTAETGASLIAAGLAVEVDEERTNVTYSATEGLMGPDGPISTGVGLEETSPGSEIYIAEVANKVDTYANLMAYAGAVGQISFASDVDVMFKHSGTAGTADIYSKNNLLYKAYLGVTATTVATSTNGNTYVPLTLNDDVSGMQALGAPVIWTAGTPTEIVLPALSATASYIVEITGLFEFQADATGLIRKLRIEYWDGSAWVSGVLNGALDIARNAALSATDPVAMDVTLFGAVDVGKTRVRVVAGHNGSGNLTVSCADVLGISVYMKTA